MTGRPKIFDDVAGIAGGAVSALAALREELSVLAKAKMEDAVRRMDLVRRDDFEAMAEVARRARVKAEALEKRLEALENREPEAKNSGS